MLRMKLAGGQGKHVTWTADIVVGPLSLRYVHSSASAGATDPATSPPSSERGAKAPPGATRSEFEVT